MISAAYARPHLLLRGGFSALALLLAMATPTLCRADAFTDGQAWGAGNNGVASGYITEQNGISIVPGYSVQGGAAVESSYFANGNGVLPGFGTAKADGCATGPRPTDSLQQQECNAINFVSGAKDQCNQLYTQIASPQLIALKTHCEKLEEQKNTPSGLPSDVFFNDYLPNCFNNPAMQSTLLTEYVRLNCDDVITSQIPQIPQTDPIAINAQMVTSDPAAVISASAGGMSLSGYYTGCQVDQTQIPPTTTTDSCYEYHASVVGAECGEARDVVVDPGHDLIPGTPCHDDGQGNCVGGVADIPAVAPSIIRDNAPPPCQGYSDTGENISHCRTKTFCTEGVNDGVGLPVTKTYGWDGSLRITHDCWSWAREYACETPIDPPTDNCSGYRGRADCQELSSTCSQYNIDGDYCVMLQHTFQCVTQPGSSGTVMNCASRQFCLDGNCFGAGSAPDKDFANAVVGKEALREAGVYQEGTYLFNGRASTCEYWPAQCCSGGGGGGYSLSNNAVMSGGGSAYHAVGSTYMYDALFASDAPGWAAKGFDAAFTQGGFDSVFAGVVTGNITLTAAGEVAIVSTNAAGVAMTTTMGMGEFALEYMVPGPWTAAIIAYQLIMSCPQDATITAMKKDTGLCVEVGGFCSRKLPIFGTCIQKKKSYCCFNSILAKIINQEGKRQRGRGNGSPQSPDCSGLTTDDFNYIDLSLADPSIWNEFIAQITPTMPVAASSAAQVGGSLPGVTQTITNYYQQ